MILSNLHTHTVYCDGKDTPEDIILEAIKQGCRTIGFSGHSYTDFDESYCMSREGTEKYRYEISGLREKYKSDIRVLLGIEQDIYSNEPTIGYDYVIGSVHYICKDGVYLTVDESKQTQIYDVNKYYGGDFYAYIEDYYALVGDVVAQTGCDIVGHFDLVTKFNENGDLFDTKSERYVKAAMGALDKLADKTAAFEINTGAIARGYRSTPYPEDHLLEEMKRRGLRLIITSDCHAKESLLLGFDKYEKLLRYS